MNDHPPQKRPISSHKKSDRPSPLSRRLGAFREPNLLTRREIRHALAELRPCGTNFATGHRGRRPQAVNPRSLETMGERQRVGRIGESQAERGRQQRRFELSSGFDFEGQDYISLRRRHQAGLRRVAYRDVEIRPPVQEEIGLIAEWFGRPEIFLALGFPRPPAQRYLERSLLPDLTGTYEKVELLLVAQHPAGRPIGFVLVYEYRGTGRPFQELDLAIAEEIQQGRAARVRHIKVAVLSYLFAVCGARQVSWVRRKRVSGGGRKSGRRSVYRRRGRDVRIDLRRFRRLLERLEDAPGETDRPLIELRADRSGTV